MRIVVLSFGLLFFLGAAGPGGAQVGAPGAISAQAPQRGAPGKPGATTVDTPQAGAGTVGDPGAITVDIPPAATGALGEPESVTVEVLPSSVRLGDPFEVKFVLVHGADVRYHLEDPVKWGSLEEKEARVEREEGRTVVHVRAAVYDRLGDIELPAFPIQARTESGGSPVELPGPALKIETVSTSDELEDILSPVEVMVPSHTWWIVSLLALAVSLGGWLVWRNRSRFLRPGAVAVAPAGPPDQRALAALGEWEQLVAEREARAQYFRLSEIVRGFLQEVGKVPALEMTSTELLHALEATEIPGLDLQRFSTWLERGDGIRYANLPVAAEEARADLEEARAFVRAVTEAMAPVEREAA